MSGAEEEDEEMSQGMHWERGMAEQFYKNTREEIDQKYTLE